MAAYRIEIGTMVFENSSIILGSLNISTAVDIVGAELAADIFTVVVDFEAGTSWIFSPSDYDGIMTEDNYLFGTADATSGDLTQTAYGTPILFYRDNVLFSKFYVRSVERVGRSKYAIAAMSAVGFLDNQRHYGGVYSGVTVEDLIDEIIGSAFTYSIDAAVQDQYVVGWLPIDTARNNLHKVMFALGISLTKDANGDIQFVFLSSSPSISVPNDRIFLGGSVDYSERVTDVEVWEHLFYKIPVEAESLFTNMGGTTADHMIVEFSEPYFDLESDGLVINESGDNYAIVTGNGTLYGKKYFHSTNVITTHIADAAVVPNVIKSSEDTLVNSLNSRSVLDRLVSYYSSKKTVRADILLAGEKAGSVISFEDAFGDNSTGIIAEQDTTASSFLKAACRIITDYTPTGQGNNYTAVTRITASGSWTVPDGVTRIRIVVIGGGTGGGGGHNGQVGRGGDKSYGGWQTYQEESYQGAVYRKVYGYAIGDGDEAGHGGSGGSGGVGGTFVVLDLDVTPGETFTVAAGSGGSGGAVSAYDADDTAGTAGTDTSVTSTHGTITSAGGQLVAEGYYDPINNEVYAAAGGDGVNGGDGGTTTVTFNNGFSGDNLAGVSGKPGTGTGTYAGGSGGAGLYSDGPDALIIHAGGGGGGGAAQGAAGGAGGAATLSGSTYRGGTGGNGANAAAPAAAGYGCGGTGGHGGGGGGNAGGADLRGQISGKSVAAGVGGTGGTGSAGANGGNGCVLFYY